MKRASIGLVSILAFGLANAEPTKPLDPIFAQAMNNAGHEMIECSAYYGVMTNGLRATPGEKFKETADEYEQLTIQTIEYALIYAQKINQKSEAVKARAAIASKEMVEQIDNNYVNSSILMQKYGEPCRAVLEDPEARLKHWLVKAEQAATE